METTIGLTPQATSSIAFSNILVMFSPFICMDQAIKIKIIFLSANVNSFVDGFGYSLYKFDANMSQIQTYQMQAHHK